MPIPNIYLPLVLLLTLCFIYPNQAQAEIKYFPIPASHQYEQERRSRFRVNCAGPHHRTGWSAQVPDRTDGGVQLVRGHSGDVESLPL